VTRYIPTYMQEGAYPAQFDRLYLGDLTRNVPCLLSGGTAFQVSQHAGSPGMSVDVQPGRIAVPGSDAPSQGSYVCWSDAVENPSVTASPPAGQSRIDSVIVQVRDDNIIGGGNNDFLVTIITGTPAATGSQHAPTIPNSSALLAQLAVGPNATSIVNANITDGRPSLLPSAMPTGIVQPWFGDPTQPPAGWTVADGRTLTRTGIGAALFAMFGTKYGAGDGSTTFNVPNLLNRMPLFGTSGYSAVGVTGGTSTITLTAGNLPSLNHAHGITDPGHLHPSTFGASGFVVYYSPSSQALQGGGTGQQATVTNNTGTSGTGVGIQATNPGGSSQPITIWPPFMCLCPLLKL